MTYQSRRRLKNRLAAARRELVETRGLLLDEIRELEEAVRHHGRRNAELTAENERLTTLTDDLAQARDRAEVHAENLRKQLDTAEAEIAEYKPHLETPHRAAAEINPHATENSRLRDENKKLHQRVAELTAANHAMSVPVTAESGWEAGA